jgi:hypothetical protein
MQMSSSVLALLAALFSSILTLGIGKVLDLIQKRQEHQYSLQKIFFEKKIKVAEAVVSNLQKGLNVLQPISTILAKVPDLSTIAETGSFLTSHFQTLSSQIQSIPQETTDYIQAASLYFDETKLKPGGMPSYEEVFNSLLKLPVLLARANALTPDTPAIEREKIKDETIKVLMEFKSHIDSLRAMIEKIIHNLRDEMKKYEP